MSSPPAVVVSVLKALDATGIRWAVLKDEPDLAEGRTTSDIDVVVDRPADVTARAVIAQLDPDHVPIALWPYDAGGTGLFVAPRAGGARVQLDLLHDPRGRGKYGLRSSEVLDAAQPGVRWPVASSRDSLLYELRKRIVKGERGLLAQLLARIEPDHLPAERIPQIFTPRASATITRVLDEGAGAARSDRGIVHRVLTVGRYLTRLRTPVGFWAHLEASRDWRPGPVNPELRPLLPQVRFVTVPDGPLARRAWWAREVAPVRWRPGLVVSWGPPPRWPRADLIRPATTETPDALVADILAAMADRARERVSSTGRLPQVRRLVTPSYDLTRRWFGAGAKAFHPMVADRSLE